MKGKRLLSYLYEKPAEPYRFHVGMRVIKTVTAALLCALLGWLRGRAPFFSMLAAVICMQNSAEKTIATSINRALGTLLGGILGVGVLFLNRAVALQQHMLPYYALVCLLLIPLIELTLAINKASATTITCTVFLSITVYHVTDINVFAYAGNRVIDTMIGIAAALLINLALPFSHGLEAPPPPEPDKPGGTDAP